MALKTREVQAGDETYTVSEIKVGVLMPILPKLQGGPEESQAAQLEIMKACVFQFGIPLGEGILELSMKAYLEIAAAVMEINGLAGEQEKKSDPT